MDQDRWYVYMLIADNPTLPYYVGKGTGNRIFQSLGEKYSRLLEEGWLIKGPQFYRAYWLFTDIFEEDVAFGLETLTIHSCDEDDVPLLNRQRRTLSSQNLHTIAAVTIEQDYIVFHPVPIELPTRLDHVLGLNSHTTIVNLHFHAALIDTLYALGNGKLTGAL